jgi:hypothetical protein
MIHFLLLISFFFLAITIKFAFSKDSLLLALPSLGWLFFMVLPFSYLFIYYTFPSTLYQSIGISIVAIIFSLTDFISIKLNHTSPIGNSKLQNSKFHSPIFIILALFNVISISIHLIFSGGSPLLNKILNKSVNLSLERELFSKTLDLPYLLKIILFWSSLPLSLILLSYLILNRRIFLFIVFLFLNVFYLVSSGAKGPITVYIFLLVLVYFFLFQRQRLNSIIKVICIFAVGLNIYAIFFVYQAANNLPICQSYNREVQNPVDVMRICVRPDNKILQTSNYLAYRVVVTPNEVSNSWYNYFLIENDPRSTRVSDYFVGSRGSSAANEVGKWAYHDRFPDNYGETISAYGSIDADLISFKNIWIIFLGVILYVFLRLSFIGVSNSNTFINLIKIVGLGMLFFLPASASIQAIFLPQGFILLTGIIYGYHLFQNLKVHNFYKRF